MSDCCRRRAAGLDREVGRGPPGRCDVVPGPRRARAPGRNAPLDRGARSARLRHPRWLARHPEGRRDRQGRSEGAWSGSSVRPAVPGVLPSAGLPGIVTAARRGAWSGTARCVPPCLARRYPDRCDRPPPSGTGPSQVGGRRPHAVISGAVARSIGRCATFARCSAISCSVARLAASSRSRICSTVARSSTAHAGPVIGK